MVSIAGRRESAKAAGPVVNRRRNGTAQMVNWATGLAASASIPTALSTGPHRASSQADSTPPKAIDQGSGFVSGALSALRKAHPAPALEADSPVPRLPRPRPCASARQADVVIIMSSSIVQITGPAAPGPSRATSSGYQMKHEVGKAATRAAKAETRLGVQVMRTRPSTLTTANTARTR